MFAINRPPKISVVMAVHNGDSYLQEAIDSIRYQSLRDLEFIIVDDASTDFSYDIILRAAKSDSRILPLFLNKNVGLTRALNHGLGHARGVFIARMDADDISLPARLKEQLTFLESRAEVMLVGCSVNYIDSSGRRFRTTSRARDNIAVRWMLRFQPAISHPTFMFRRVCPDGTELRYDPSFSVAQDYDFVCRMVDHGDVINLPGAYLNYRVHPNMVSRKKYDAQGAAAKRIADAYQRRTMVPEVYLQLADLRECYFERAPATLACRNRVLRGARAMLQADMLAMPTRRRWLSRQTAQLAVWAMQRGGASKIQILSALSTNGIDLLAPAIMRALEIKKILPPFLKSDPRI